MFKMVPLGLGTEVFAQRSLIVTFTSSAFNAPEYKANGERNGKCSPLQALTLWQVGLTLPQ